MTIDGIPKQVECRFEGLEGSDGDAIAETKTRLLDLCKIQLQSARRDAEKQFEKIASHGLSAVELAEEMLVDLNRIEGAGENARRLSGHAERLKRMSEGLIIEFQFFDEFSQRLEHIEDAIKDHQEDSFWGDGGEVMRQRLERMFSTKSEFAEFVKIFPDTNKKFPCAAAKDAELF